MEPQAGGGNEPGEEEIAVSRQYSVWVGRNSCCKRYTPHNIIYTELKSSKDGIRRFLKFETCRNFVWYCRHLNYRHNLHNISKHAVQYSSMTLEQIYRSTSRSHHIIILIQNSISQFMVLYCWDESKRNMLTVKYLILTTDCRWNRSDASRYH